MGANISIRPACDAALDSPPEAEAGGEAVRLVEPFEDPQAASDHAGSIDEAPPVGCDAETNRRCKAVPRRERVARPDRVFRSGCDIDREQRLHIVLRTQS